MRDLFWGRSGALLGAGAGFGAVENGVGADGADGAGGAEDELGGGAEDVGALGDAGDGDPGAGAAGWDDGPKYAGFLGATGSPGLPLVSGTLNDRLLSAVPRNRSVTIR